jgi:hypothetical protein
MPNYSAPPVYSTPAGGTVVPSAPTLLNGAGVSRPMTTNPITAAPAAPMPVSSFTSGNATGLVSVGPPNISPPANDFASAATQPVTPPMAASHGAPPLLNPTNSRPPMNAAPVTSAVEFPTQPQRSSGFAPSAPRTQVKPLPLLPDPEVSAPLPPSDRAPPLLNTGDRTAHYSPVRGASAPIRWEAVPARESGTRLARGE